MAESECMTSVKNSGNDEYCEVLKDNEGEQE